MGVAPRRCRPARRPAAAAVPLGQRRPLSRGERVLGVSDVERVAELVDQDRHHLSVAGEHLGADRRQVRAIGEAGRRVPGAGGTRRARWRGWRTAPAPAPDRGRRVRGGQQLGVGHRGRSGQPLERVVPALAGGPQVRRAVVRGLRCRPGVQGRGQRGAGLGGERAGHVHHAGRRSAHRQRPSRCRASSSRASRASASGSSRSRRCVAYGAQPVRVEGLGVVQQRLLRLGQGLRVHHVRWRRRRGQRLDGGADHVDLLGAELSGQHRRARRGELRGDR